MLDGLYILLVRADEVVVEEERVALGLQLLRLEERRGHGGREVKDAPSSGSGVWDI